MTRRLSPAALLLFGTGLAATTAFSRLSAKVRAHQTANFDGRVRRRFPKRRRPPTKKAAKSIGPIGKEWVHGPISALVALFLWRHQRHAAAAGVVFASVASAGLSHLFEAAITPRKPPPGRHSPTEPSFPSGHSLETSAVAMTIAYMLTREGFAVDRVAWPAALAVPAISGVGRVYLDRHWATDVLGGWLAGTAVAAMTAAVYEMAAD